MQDVFELLKREMRTRGWNVARLAAACATDGALTSRWVAEDPERRVIPGPRSCAKIAAALDLDPDYVLELAGHRKPREPRPEVDAVQAELDARLARLGATLSKYPRPFWVAVIDASERVAAAADVISGPVNAQPGQRVSAPNRGRKRGQRGADGPFTANYRPHRALAFAGA